MSLLSGLDPQAQRLIAALRAPHTLSRLPAGEWAALIAAARAANLVGTLAVKLAAAGVSAPAPAERHLAGARQLALRQRLSVQWEAHALQAALGHLGVPVLLLKGAAYVMSADGLGAGRMFGDIDVLVPRAALGDVESALMLAGWVSAAADAYDQHYYRTWMHELPPMTHARRGTVVDVHHTILPLTARNAPDPLRILARSSPVPGLPALHVPAVEDLVIHSITHLVHEGELHNGLRDLHDIDALLLQFGAQPGFWPRLLSQAVDNDLAGPLLLGLRLAQAFFDSPVPTDALAALAKTAGPTWRRRWLPAVYARALQLDSEAPATWSAQAARLLIYVRSHALRMPAPLLARHLTIKAWKGLVARQEPPPPPAATGGRLDIDGA